MKAAMYRLSLNTLGTQYHLLPEARRDAPFRNLLTRTTGRDSRFGLCIQYRLQFERAARASTRLGVRQSAFLALSWSV